MIQFDNVSKQYWDGNKAVNLINLHIKEGEFFVIIGPSGSGKTTVLKMINRLIPLTSGTIFINGKRISDYDIHELRWDIGYVLQQIALFPHMTIGENIAIVPELKNWEQMKINERINELLEMVGLEPDIYRSRKPHELSGGQQQRVGVTRALAANPPIILMDEPFSALDPLSREKLQDDLIHLQKKIKKTIVFVTHDMKEALKLGDRICVMKDGEIVQIGTPEELLANPENEFVRQFVGEEQGPYMEEFSLHDILLPISEAEQNGSVISASASLEETLSLLAINEELAVEEGGTIIGMINRQAVIRKLARSMQREVKS
ncbi:glycine/betaine ABC transporter ATP-binding protein [Cytobacillus firmus]|uniref:ABC transporter ATP-binding protein n=1 Tax=Cytobacillus firmus TaxID=1399 RepID=UPI00077C9510|nr:ABC transporter ATP-binding protein [Cytobacillus firmus]MBG9542439.1 glycine/betaine ABC transporter ATP-binding protein [Cytobacillus firmus]MBG9552011.1 glycine/betaine ABC transporter ATP-binding protein [Cytobacillus firmus]MBG9558358.1 glycine/betaine ABC transporter ATP-binding protein [Cytobacillus firmus]MBG9573455.1 glycine/betaine ABC transporter ATP-binding protein [Cytobacillus firmus]MEC1891837.1 ABC transporter ATP-binding protein [Cytobacillus firmus]